MANETDEIAPERRLKRVKLTMQDVNAIAELVAKSHLTETESCLNLGIKPLSWFRFKERARVKAEFVTVLTRLKGSHIRNCIKRINDSGDGIGVKQADWRAKAWILERVAPERFAQQPAVAPANVQIVDISSMRRAYDAPPRALNAINLHPDCETMSGQRAIELNAPSAKLGAKVKCNIPPKKG